MNRSTCYFCPPDYIFVIFRVKRSVPTGSLLIWYLSLFLPTQIHSSSPRGPYLCIIYRYPCHVQTKKVDHDWDIVSFIVISFCSILFSLYQKRIRGFNFHVDDLRVCVQENVSLRIFLNVARDGVGSWGAERRTPPVVWLSVSTRFPINYLRLPSQ